MFLHPTVRLHPIAFLAQEWDVFVERVGKIRETISMANETNRTNGLTYSDAGVNIDAGNALVNAIKPLARSTARPGADAALGGFGGLFDLAATGYRDPLLVAANDGVGTKLKVAFEVGKHDTVGIDLVAMCVNDLLVQGAEPLFFLDYFACGKLDNAVATEVVSGIAEGCRQAGAALIGGETAEMPGMYGDGDYDLAGFAVGAVERDGLLPRGDIAAGDRLIGLPSSGVHSNGFSLIRRILDASEELLVPTRIYVADLLVPMQSGLVKGAAHITGGGLLENIPRVLPDDVTAHIDLAQWHRAEIFHNLARNGGIDDMEMLRTFNCGIGMVAVVGEDHVDGFLGEIEGALVIGQLGPNDGEAIRFTGQLLA